MVPRLTGGRRLLRWLFRAIATSASRYRHCYKVLFVMRVSSAYSKIFTYFYNTIHQMMIFCNNVFVFCNLFSVQRQKIGKMKNRVFRLNECNFTCLCYELLRAWQRLCRKLVLACISSECLLVSCYFELCILNIRGLHSSLILSSLTLSLIFEERFGNNEFFRNARVKIPICTVFINKCSRNCVTHLLNNGKTIMEL